MSDERGERGQSVVHAEPGLDVEILQALSSLPDDELHEVASVVFSRSSFHAGPIPAPETLAGYKEVHADAPDRILTMAEKQQAHDIEMHGLALRSEISYRNRTLAAATAFALATVAGATALGMYGHDVAAVGVGVSGSAAIVIGALIRGRDLFPKSEPPKPPPAKSKSKRPRARPKR